MPRSINSFIRNRNVHAAFFSYFLFFPFLFLLQPAEYFDHLDVDVSFLITVDFTFCRSDYYLIVQLSPAACHTSNVCVSCSVGRNEQIQMTISILFSPQLVPQVGDSVPLSTLCSGYLNRSVDCCFLQMRIALLDRTHVPGTQDWTASLIISKYNF